MSSKMIKMLGGIIGGFVVLIIIIFVIASCSKKKLNYVDIQTSAKRSAVRYYNDNKKDLPSSDGDTTSITLKKLISEGYLEDPAKTYKNDELSCDGTITVSNNNGFYLYSPNISCNKDYKTTLLKDKIVDNSLVETGPGLYQNKDEYVFKGEVTNNYVKFPDTGEVFRIIRINSDGTIRLMQTDSYDDELVSWDDRYNIELGSEYGINEYIYNDINSRIKDAVNGYYNNTSLWTDTAKSYVTTQTLCIGKRSTADSTKDGSTECSVKLAGQQFGLIAAYEFLEASLDNNCTSTESTSCANYNWLSNAERSTWTITASSESSAKIYQLYYTLSKSYAYNQKRAMLVFNMSSNAYYISGTGTSDDPYVFA
ncbi:MAG TPA: hypothetical protein PLB45_04775 [Bacilli bacterium]|nr:hypothetical protein [Bacilli bacterium]HPZ23831.1 hypothetical protein [Bacilli bacterium]HQC84160.1 hypothetical protein [Bacilli bacterium]